MTKKISFLSINYGYGGAEKMFDTLASSFRDSHPNYFEQSITIDRNKSSLFSSLLMLSRLRGRTVILNCSVLGIGWVWSLLLTLIGATIVLYPHIIIDHRTLGSKLPRIRNFQMRLAIAFSTQIIAISKGNESKIRSISESTSILPIRNFIISNPVHPTFKNTQVSKVAIIGRIQEKHKRQQETLKSIIALIKSRAISIDIFGSGPDQAHLEALLNAEGIEEQCRLHGWIAEEEIFMHDFGIVVNNSAWEGLPLSLLESINNYRLVIGNNIPGNAEIILEELRFSTPDELNQIIQRILSLNPNEIAALLDRQKANIGSDYSLDSALSILKNYAAA